jgi:hypothetical protein
MRIERSFEDTVASFQNFLKESGHPSNLIWVFRDDIWQRPETVLVKYPTSPANKLLAQKVFNEGCVKGLISINAIAATDDEVAATVWFPKFTGEEVQGWDGGIKLSIDDPLPRATFIKPTRWLFMQFLPQFRQYQQREWTIGTQQWAAA